MRKLRGTKSRGSLIDLASESSAAAASTAMTLWHRLPMFGIACDGAEPGGNDPHGR